MAHGRLPPGAFRAGVAPRQRRRHRHPNRRSVDDRINRSHRTRLSSYGNVSGARFVILLVYRTTEGTARSASSRICRALALSWSALTASYLVVLCILILYQPQFPLNLGSLRTTGRTGLLITAPPAVVAMAALPLIFLGAKAGSWLLAIYSAFWTAVLVCALPAIWNVRSSFCTSSFCIRTPWIGRLAVLALATLFLLLAVWARKQAARSGSKTASE